MFSSLFEHILKEEEKRDFEEIFQPLTPEEHEKRLMDYIKEFCYQNPDGTWSADGDVDLFNMGLIKFPVRFKVVKGNFNCSTNNLTSLEGSPEKVGGTFDCTFNNLISLEGAPKKVGGDFDCAYNKLISLEGSPEEVEGDFICYWNKLTTLVGAPKIVRGTFDCSENKLTSGTFDCSENKLTSLEGAPKEVGKDFDCRFNKLITLEGAPQKVGGEIFVGINSKSVEELKKTIDRPYMEK